MSAFRGREIACLRGERLVLRDIAFDLAAGDALVLRGPNGSGKTTLLRCMAGLLRLAAGQLSWDDEDVAEEPEQHRARLHYVGHLDGLKAVLSARENVALWPALRGATARDAAAAAERGLDALGVAHLADAPVRMLSAGQRKRVALARLIAVPAPLWLLDEPNSSLDRIASGHLAAAIAEHRAGGGMVVLSSHDAFAPDDAAALELDPAMADPAGDLSIDGAP